MEGAKNGPRVKRGRKKKRQRFRMSIKVPEDKFDHGGELK